MSMQSPAFLHLKCWMSTDKNISFFAVINMIFIFFSSSIYIKQFFFLFIFLMTKGLFSSLKSSVLFLVAMRESRIVQCTERWTKNSYTCLLTLLQSYCVILTFWFSISGIFLEYGICCDIVGVCHPVVLQGFFSGYRVLSKYLAISCQRV